MATLFFWASTILGLCSVTAISTNITSSGVTVVVIADKGSQLSLRAAQCTYLEIIDPAEVIHVSDFELPKIGGCGYVVKHHLQVAFATDYFSVLEALFKSNIQLEQFTLIVKPSTFVHPWHLARFVKRIGDDDAYVGRMRNATTQLSALDHMPHVASEYGVMLRSWTIDVLADRRLRSPETDYVASEKSAAGLGAVLFSTDKMVQPIDRPNYFVPAWPDFKGSVSEFFRIPHRNRLVTFGPVDPLGMVALARHYRFYDAQDSQPGLLDSSRANQSASSASAHASELLLPGSFKGSVEEGLGTAIARADQLQPRLLFAVLVREDSALKVVKSAVLTWASGPTLAATGASVLFFFGRRQTDIDIASVQDVANVLASPSRQMIPDQQYGPPERHNGCDIYADLLPSHINESHLSSAIPSVRLIGLDLPLQPADTNYYKASTRKSLEWDKWLRIKVKSILRFLTNPDFQRESRYDFFIFVDDDSYIQLPALRRLLATHDASEPIAVGRKFTCAGKGALLGGGPGIAMSRGALAAARAADCAGQQFPINSRAVPGGDGWLGQCMALAKITILNDWRFKSLPPFAYTPNERAHAVSFHKSNVREAHSWLDGSQEPMGGPLCNPVLLRDSGTVVCLPHFIIIGAQKSGTTSAFKYLGEHPNVVLPIEKEMNWFGSPWPLPGSERAKSLAQFTFSYLAHFNTSSPSDSFIKITGEASPDYLVSAYQVLPNLLRFMPSIKIIVSLREPVERMISAYENKVADATVRRHMQREVSGVRRIDRRKDHEVHDYVVPAIQKLALDVNNTLNTCGDYGKHFTLFEDRQEDNCYVNPFVLHGYYAKYLRPWIRAFGGERGQLLLVDFHDFSNDSSSVMNTMAHFLGLPPFKFTAGEVFNSRKNRGVHSAAGKHSTGGVIRGLSKEKLGALESWSSKLGVDANAILRQYYSPCNAELAQLIGGKPLSWLVRGTPNGSMKAPN